MDNPTDKKNYYVYRVLSFENLFVSCNKQYFSSRTIGMLHDRSNFERTCIKLDITSKRLG